VLRKRPVDVFNGMQASRAGEGL